MLINIESGTFEVWVVSKRFEVKWSCKFPTRLGLNQDLFLAFAFRSNLFSYDDNMFRLTDSVMNRPIKIRRTDHTVSVWADVADKSLISILNFEGFETCQSHIIEYAVGWQPRTPGPVVFFIVFCLDKQHFQMTKVLICKAICQTQTGRASPSDDDIVIYVTVSQFLRLNNDQENKEKGMKISQDYKHCALNVKYLHL